MAEVVLVSLLGMELRADNSVRFALVPAVCASLWTHVRRPLAARVHVPACTCCFGTNSKPPDNMCNPVESYAQTRQRCSP